jgi:hypothetical protein
MLTLSSRAALDLECRRWPISWAITVARMFCSYRHSFLASSATRPAPEDLIFTHIFGWTPPVGFEVLFSPRLPRASYQGTASAVPTGGKQNGGFSRR